MFTAGSASHIRVSVKDDTLGLGARPRRDALDEPTGLDAFKGLLGRLNGKSDTQLEEDQRKRDDVKLARYAATKYQVVRFISGGLLTQEKLDPLPPKAPKTENQRVDGSNESADERNHETNIDCNVDDSQDVSSKKSKKKSSRSKRTDEDSKSQRKREKKAKKRKHSEESDGLDSKPQPKTVDEPETNITTVSSTAIASSKERRPLGRNAIRGRHIAQKKKALLDDKSLNEVRSLWIHIYNHHPGLIIN